jgi:ribonuclease D
MKRDYGFQVVNMFDTMYAARLVDNKLYGLAELLNKHYDIKPDKRHQLDNWGKRPLSESSLAYAQMDTHFLLPLRDHYMEKLQALDALPELREVFNDICLADPKEQAVDPEGFWKLVKPKELNKKQLAVLAELYRTRESIAEEMDVPPFKAIDNRVLVNLALQSPSNRRELGAMRGLRPEMIRVYADDILDAIDRGHQNKPPQPPVAPKVDQVIADRYILLHAWRKEKAIARKLESNMVVSKTMLWDIAHKVPHTLDDLAQLEGMGAWRLAAYGEEILNVLHKNKRP